MSGTFNINQINVNVTDVIPPDNFATVDVGGKIGTVYTKDQDNEWRAEVEATTQSGIKGVLKPNTAYDPVTNPYPTPWVQGNSPLYEKYDVNQAGPFPNTKDVNDENINVTQNELDLNEVQIWIKNGVAEKVLKAMPQASVNVRRWEDLQSSDFPLTEGNQVIYNFGHYVVPEGKNALLSDVPNISENWESISGSFGSDQEFINRAEKTISSKQLFDYVIGDFEFPGDVYNLDMDIPEPNFNMNNADQYLDGTSWWSISDSLYSDMDFVTEIDLLFRQLYTFPIAIFNRNDLSAPEQIINVAPPISIGVKTHVFSSPINNTTHKICIGDGFCYYGSPVSVGTQQLYQGAFIIYPTLVLGANIRGYRTVIGGGRKIIERLDLLEEKSTKFTNDLYFKEKSSINYITEESLSSVFNVDSNGLNLTSNGQGNGVFINIQTNLNKRYLELKCKLYSNSIIYVGTKSVEPTAIGETNARINCSTGQLIIDALSVAPGSGVIDNIGFNIVNGREYFIRLYKIDNTVRLQILDCVNGVSKTVVASQFGQYDKYKFGVISSSNPITFSQVAIKSIIDKQPYIIFYGDSITDGAGVTTTDKRFADLIGNKLNQAYLVSGRGAGTIIGVVNRMRNELPVLRPKYVFVTIGTNGSNTVQNLNDLVDYCESLGVEVILNLIPLYDGTTAAKNLMIQDVVDSRKLKSVKFNIATSINGDGSTIDHSLYLDESGVFIHPNDLGNEIMFRKALVDIPEVFSEVGVY